MDFLDLDRLFRRGVAYREDDGAFLLELLRVADAGVFLTPAYLAGFGAAGGAGLGALKLLTGLIHRNRFHVFAPYLLAAAAVTAAALLV